MNVHLSSADQLDGPDALRQLVLAHDPGDNREELSKARILAELDRLETPCDRHADRVHVTGSAIIAGTRGTVLHVHRRYGHWMQPGGHVEPGESPAQAALREAREETGLAVSHPDCGPELVHLDVHLAGDHVHLDFCYLLLAPDEDPSPGPRESMQVRWFDWDEAEVLVDEALIGALRRAKKAVFASSLKKAVRPDVH